MNQIFLGLTDGSTMALFDPVISKNGAVTCLSKQEREYVPEEITSAIKIRTPHSLPLFRDAPISR